MIYRIITKISPGLIFGQITFFWLIFEGAYFREAYFRKGYFRDEIRVRKGGGLIIEGCISATETKK